jgi:hypothetical protein
MSEGPDDKPNPPCPQCGSTEFETGLVGSAVYWPDPERVFMGWFAPFKRAQAIRARKCLSCGHLALFAKP